MAVGVGDRADENPHQAQNGLPPSPPAADDDAAGDLPRPPVAFSTTTISTIAIKAGDTSKLVLAVLKNGNATEIRVDQMEPSLLDIGDGYDQAVQLQQEHATMMQKLEAKQTSVEELLSKADLLVSEKPPEEAVVYEAMAHSLGSAWRDLNDELQLRGQLLSNAVQFYSWFSKFEEVRAQLEVCTAPMPTADESEDAIRKRLKECEELQIDLLDSVLETMTYGESVIENLRAIGVVVNNEERPAETLKACEKVEEVMLRVNEESGALAEACKDSIEQLKLCAEASQLCVQLKNLREWIRQTDEELKRFDCGDSEMSSQYLLNDHEELCRESTKMQEVLSLITTKLEQLSESGMKQDFVSEIRLGDIEESFARIISQLQNRHQLLTLVVRFFKEASVALSGLLIIEQELGGLSLSKNKKLFIQKHEEYATKASELVDSPLSLGRSILQQAGYDAVGVQGVAKKLKEIEERYDCIHTLCVLNKEELLEQDQRYRILKDKQTHINQWLSELRNNLDTYRTLGSTYESAVEFLDQHRQFMKEVQQMESDCNSLLLETVKNQHAIAAEDAAKFSQEVEETRTTWQKVKGWIDSRLKLADEYKQFHEVANTVAKDMEEMNRTLMIVQPTELVWSSLTAQFQHLRSLGKQFHSDSDAALIDQNLDVKSAQNCVTSTMDKLEARLQLLQQSCAERLSKLQSERSFKEEWRVTQQENYKFIHYISELERDASMAFSRFDDSPAIVVENHQRVLKDVLPKMKLAQEQASSRLRAVEEVGAKGDTQGEKERLSEELLRSGQRLQTCITDYEILSSMTVTFFRNLQRIDELINQVSDRLKFEPSAYSTEQVEAIIQEQSASTKAISELLRFVENEGQEIIMKSASESFTPEIRRECEKIPQIISRRSEKWHEFVSTKNSLLDETRNVRKFETQLAEIEKTITYLHEQILDMRSHLGNSSQAVDVCRDELKKLEEQIKITDDKIQRVKNDIKRSPASTIRTNARLNECVQTVDRQWTQFYEELHQLRSSMVNAVEYWTLLRETETWITEVTEYIKETGRLSADCKTENDSKQLKAQFDGYVDRKSKEQEQRLKRFRDAAVQLYGEEANHKTETYTKRYMEIVDSLHEIKTRLVRLTETFTTREMESQEITSTVQTYKSPIFVQRLRDQQVNEGAKAELVCRVEGAPSPGIEWLKDGCPVADNPDYETSQLPNGECRLRIEETFVEDSAVYTCRAKNVAGSAETSAKLTVKEQPTMRPPEFVKQINSCTLEAGSTQIFECQTSGMPTPSTSWFKNNVCIDNSPRAKIFRYNNVSRLTMEGVDTSDSGDYACWAKNPVGETVTCAKLVVVPKPIREPPKFSTGLKDVTVQSGEGITLRCEVTGIPQPYLLWKRDGYTLPESENVKPFYDGRCASLTITNAILSDSGLYTLLARNEVGEDQTSCRVTVTAAAPAPVSPTRPLSAATETISEDEWQRVNFTRELKNIIVNEGDDVILECSFSGTLQPKIIWKKNSQLLYGNQRYQVLFEPHRCMLKIDNVRREDAGCYTCIAITNYGEAATVCNLTVNPAKRLPNIAPRFVQTITSQVITETSRVMFETRVHGEPEPQVEWYKDGILLIPDANRQILRDNSGWHRLVINSVSKSDSGTYKVVASNPEGQIESVATLQVVDKPQLPVKTTSQTYVTETYQTQSVSAKAVGTPPNFVRHLQDVATSLGSEAKFDICVGGNPRPKVTWLFNGKPILAFDQTRRMTNFGDVYTLTIPKVDLSHCGVYGVDVENSRGTIHGSARLSIVKPVPVSPRAQPDYLSSMSYEKGVLIEKRSVNPPHFIQPLVSVAVTENAEAKFEGILSGSPVPEVTWLKDGKEIFDTAVRRSFINGRASLVIPKAALEHGGKYTCIARNSGGKATSTAILSVLARTEPPDFVERLVSQEAVEGSSLRWNVKISGIPTPEVRWLRNEEEIRSCIEVQIIQDDAYSHALYIPNLHVEDSGKFTVVATNSAGEARSTADLIVRLKTERPGVYYHTTKVFQQQKEIGMETSGYRCGPQPYREPR